MRHVIVLLLSLLAGCAAMPGDTLFDVVREPIPQDALVIMVEHHGVARVDRECRQLAGDIPIPFFFNWYRACATLYPGRYGSAEYLAEHPTVADRDPRCLILLPHGSGVDSNLYRHEMRHCLGYAD